MHFAECGFKVFKGFCTKMIIWRHPDDAFREVERTRMHQNRFHAISNVPACILTTNAEKYQKKSIALRGRENFYWSLEKNVLHVWILFGFCPSPPTKKLKEMEEKYQPHPCSAQTGSTQDIN